MRAYEFLKESTTTLNKLYNGNFPDRDESFWDEVRPHEFDNELEVKIMPKHKLSIMLQSQYRVEHLDEILDMMDEDQQEILQRYMNDPNLSNKIILLSGDRIIDGNHRALAAALKGVPIKYVDLADLDEQDVTEDTSKLNYIGNCTDDDVIEHLFGDATGFAQAVDEYGDDFELDDLVVKYDPDSDIHSFYYKQQGVTEDNENTGGDYAIHLGNLKRFFKGEDPLAELVPERRTHSYALYSDIFKDDQSAVPWRKTFASLTGKDFKEVLHNPKILGGYRPKKFSIPPGTLVGDMHLANMFYSKVFAKTPEEKQEIAKKYKESLVPFNGADLSKYVKPELLIPKQQGMAEGKIINTYLWHGSRHKNEMLHPRQAVDTGGAAGSNQNAIYATSDPKVAIAMGLTTSGSDTGMFPNDPQMVLFSGDIRKGKYVYLHKLPMNGPDGKPQFVQGGNSREFHSVPDVKQIKPIEIKEVPVNKYLNLIRKATKQDWALRKKYMKNEGVAEGFDKEAGAWRDWQIKMLPRKIEMLSRLVKGWVPSEEDHIAAIEAGYDAMKETGDVKDAAKAIADTLKEIQSRQGMAEGKQQVERNGIQLNVSIDGATVDIRPMINGNQVGYVVFDRDGKTLVADDLAIDEEYRGRGIAKIIYDYLKELGFTVKRSTDQLPAGKAFWDKYKGVQGQVWEDEHVDEMALSTYKTMGDFSKPGPFTGADKKLVPHPKNIEKATRFFEQTPFDFRLFFSHLKGTGKYSEHGPMSHDQIRQVFGQDSEEIINGSEDAITVVYVGNKGDAKVMLTPWMMAHRFGHAINAGARNKNWTAWGEAENYFFQTVNNLLDEHYGKVPATKPPGRNMLFQLTPEYNALFNAMGTQRSSTSGQIRRPYEFLYELFAQYLGTGKVTLNPLPTNLGYGRRVFGNPTKYMNIKPEYRDEGERKQAADSLAYTMELLFNDVLSDSVGKIFVM